MFNPVSVALVSCENYTAGRTITSRQSRLLIGIFVSCLCLLVGIAGMAGVASAENSGTAIDSCQAINESGSYYLNTSLTSGSSQCIGINATDVVFDGNGENIENSNRAVKITATTNASNITVRNLTIRDAADEGVRAAVGSNSTRNLTVSNVTMENVDKGFYVPSTSESTPRVEFAIRNSSINATSKGVYVFKNDVGQYDVEVEDTVINTTKGDNGVGFSVTENRTDVDLLMLDNTIESDGSDAVSLNLERSHATTELELRGNDINVTGSLSDAFNLRDGDSPGPVNTTVNVTADSNTLTTSDGTALYLELWGAEGSRDIDLDNNTIDAGNSGYDVVAKGNDTSVEFRAVDNNITSEGNQILDIQGDQYDPYPNQTFDLEIARNTITEEVKVNADGRDARVNASVTNNTLTDADVSLRLNVVRYNANRSVEIRGNRANGSLFISTGGRYNVTSVAATNNTVETGSNGIEIEVEGRRSTGSNYAPYQDVDISVSENVVNGTQGIYVNGNPPLSTLNLGITDNELLSSGDSGRLFLEADGDDATVDATIRNNTVVDGSNQGYKTSINGQNTTANISLIDNTADVKEDPIAFFPRGDDQDLDFELADNDLNVTQAGTSRHGILVGETGRNSTVAFSAVNNTINSTQQGIEFHLGLDSGDDPRDPIDIQVEDNVINASNEALKIFDEDTSDFATDRNLTVSVRDNRITSGDQSSTSNDGQGVDIQTRNDRGSNNVTITGNVIDVTTPPVTIQFDGGETVQNLSITNNSLTSATSRGTSLSIDVTSSFLGPDKTEVNVSENIINSELSGIDLTVKEESMSVNFTALDNTITTTAADKDGILAEVSADKMTVNADVSGNELDVKEDGIDIELFSDKMNTTVTASENVLNPGASTGVALRGGTGTAQNATWDVSDNVIDQAETGIFIENVKMRDAGSYDVTVQDNTVTDTSEVGLEIDSEVGSGASSQSGRVDITKNNISSAATTVRINDDGGPVDGIDLSNNRFDANDWGVENLNTTAGYVNATDNYWGASDGPGSPADLEDPVTGALADGGGSNVTERGGGVSNVHFDPYLTSPPDLGGTADFTATIDSTNAPITEGETLTVDATVENTGTANGTQTVTLSTNGTERESTTLSLNSSESQSVTLNWSTSNGDDGSYTATVETADDSATTSVDVTTESDDGDEDSTTGSSGGGGGGGSPTTDEDGIEESPDTEVTTAIEGSSVEFETTERVSSVSFDEEASGSVEVQEYEEPPTPVVESVSDAVDDGSTTGEESDGGSDDGSTGGSTTSVVTVADISPTDPDVEQSSATVEFEVDRGEFDDPNNAVILHETDDGWTEVETTVEATDGETMSVEGRIDSFSLFAVAEVESDDTSTTQTDGRNANTDDGTTTDSAESSSGGLPVGLLSILVAGIAGAAVFIFRRRGII